jgi:RNA polymerase sigma-70 factor (ECF subfamily)
MVDFSAARVDLPASTIQEAVAGDTAALARIVRANHDDMARICFVVCGDQDVAQDAVQAAWLIAWRKLGSLRDPSRLRPWLMSIAANEARQIMRRKRRVSVIEIDVDDAVDDRMDPATRSASLDLAMVLRRLEPDDRALLALRYVAGYDASEIGRELHRSPSTVRSQLARLTARLRRDLGDD